MDIALAREIAIKAARGVGGLLLENLHSRKDVFFKGKGDIRTDIDIKAESAILGIIRKNFPEHDILSEESGYIANSIGGGSEFKWVVDPIDGTINYFSGGSPFRVGICLLKNNEPLLATIYNPVRDQVCFAEKDKGVFLNGRKISVSGNSSIGRSVILTHISSRDEVRTRALKVLDNLFNTALHIRVFGCGLAAMSYIAEGKFDAFFNLSTKPWDILPGALMVKEAGGVVTDINGKEITADSTSVVATNGLVHDQLLDVVKGV